MNLPHIYESRSKSGFTLIEIILAIGITIGLLLVAVYFYHQSANLRSQLIDRSEAISQLQATMDRLTFDLRAAMNSRNASFEGTSTSLTFIALSPPLMRGGFTGPSSDLHRLHYAVLYRSEGTNHSVSGLGRSEHLQREAPAGRGERHTLITQPNSSLPPAPAPPAPPNFAEGIRHAQFRYFDGQAWVPNWNGTLPAAVEIVLGLEPAPESNSTSETENLASSESDFEYFRRIVRIPASTIHPAGFEPEANQSRSGGFP